jgi:hypothetical protein
LQVQSSLARAVTVDNEVATNSRTLHTLTVVRHYKKDPETMTRIEFICFLKDFKTDLEQNKSNWENKTLEDFLDSMIEYSGPN